jgi:hypothetical protein
VISVVEAHTATPPNRMTMIANPAPMCRRIDARKSFSGSRFMS